jgi:hypothetical protein
MTYAASLEDALKESNWDMIKHSSVLYDKLREFDHAGGNVSTIESLVFGVFLKIPHENFKNAFRNKRSEITKDAQGLSGPDLARYVALESLRCIPDIVQDLSSHNDWDLGPKKNKKTKQTNGKQKDSSASDIASFKAEFKNDLEELKALYVANNQSTAEQTKPNPLTGARRFMRCPEQWTNSDSFDSAAEFDSFVSGDRREEIGEVVKANGSTWRWCEHCNRMGNHATSYCRNKPPTKRKTSNGDIPTLKKKTKSSKSLNLNSTPSQDTNTQTFIADQQLDDDRKVTFETAEEEEDAENESALFGILNGLNMS